MVKNSLDDDLAVYAQLSIRAGWLDPVQEANQYGQALDNTRPADSGILEVRSCKGWTEQL